MATVHVKTESGSDSDDRLSADNTDPDEADTAGRDLETQDCALADVISKILTKPVPGKKTGILAQGQTDKEIQRRKRLREKKNASVEKEPKQKQKSKSDDQSSALSGASDEESDEPSRKTHLRRKEWENLGRVKPNFIDRDREKTLQKIATRGVVQLFNAVRQQQNLKGEAASNPRSQSHRKTKGTTTKNFLDLLDNSKVKKEKAQDDTSGKWSILRDDFMMGARMKDWDKDNDGDDGGGDENSLNMNDDMSDSD